MQVKLWDYTCFYCKGRGSPDQAKTGKGHSSNCPIYKKANRLERG